MKTRPARLVTTTALVMLMCSSVWAQSPAVDESTKDIELTGKPMLIDTQIRMSTTVILPDDEQVMNVATGDATFWDIQQPQPNMLTIKPSKEGAATNATVFGASGRVYPFLLKESKKAPNLIVTIKVSDKDGNMTAPKFVPVSRLAELEAQLSAAQQEMAAADVQADVRRTAEAAQLPGKVQFLWAPVTYTSPFKVRAVWTDGEKTYIRTDANEQFSVYEMKDGKPSLIVPDAPLPNIVRVGKVLDAFYLQLGEKQKQRILPFPGN